MSESPKQTPQEDLSKRLTIHNRHHQDPAVKEVRGTISKRFHRAPNDSDIHHITATEWDRFVEKYPEKATAYKDQSPLIQQALERKEAAIKPAVDAVSDIKALPEPIHSIDIPAASIHIPEKKENDLPAEDEVERWNREMQEVKERLAVLATSQKERHAKNAERRAVEAPKTPEAGTAEKDPALTAKTGETPKIVKAVEIEKEVGKKGAGAEKKPAKAWKDKNGFEKAATIGTMAVAPGLLLGLV